MQVAKGVSEQGRPSQKSEGLNGMAAVCVYDCLVVAVVWWGRGKEARRVEGEARNIQIQVGLDFFNLGLEGFGGVGCRGKVDHMRS